MVPLNVKLAFYFLIVYIVCLLTSNQLIHLVQIIMCLELVSIIINFLFFCFTAFLMSSRRVCKLRRWPVFFYIGDVKYFGAFPPP